MGLGRLHPADQPPVRQPVQTGVPLGVGPPRVSLRNASGSSPVARCKHQCLDRVEVVQDQGGDVAVAPELSQEGLGVPQHEVVGLGQGRPAWAAKRGRPS